MQKCNIFGSFWNKVLGLLEVYSANMSNFFKIIPLSQYFSLANVCFGDSLDVGFDQVYESEFGQIKPLFAIFYHKLGGFEVTSQKLF